MIDSGEFPTRDSLENSADALPVALPARRMFLFEKGWTIGLKTDSHREFCYQMAPGQNYYHRLQDGEVYLQRDVEKLCMACAARRGLLASEPKQLKEQFVLLPEGEDRLPLEVH